MLANGKPSILIVGCGLIGTSLALAWRTSDATTNIDGLDTSPNHLAVATRLGALDSTFCEWPSRHYDVVVLATPVDVAITQIETAARLGDVVMDVCSVKQTLCDAIKIHGLETIFAPTHPMAGLATGGPHHATADLFKGKPFIALQGYPAVERIIPLIQATGGRMEWLDTAENHDRAMAIVSHSIHLTSLAAMNAFRLGSAELETNVSRLTGPGFRDVTRLAASPSDFWIGTLQANRVAVTAQMERVIASLERMRNALQTGDTIMLRHELDTARQTYESWREEHGL